MNAAGNGPPAHQSRTFEVDRMSHFLGGIVCRNSEFFIKLGNVETSYLGARIEHTDIRAPIFIAGLARSGSTILLETLAACPGVATHQYRDFSFIFILYWWRKFLAWTAKKAEVPRERAHRDGLEVTSASPEAMEEILWMAFFDHIHDPSASNILDGATHNPPFERFFRDHVRKLLAADKAARYASKGNYNLTRLEYLLKLFPDARVILPIRHPIAHIASLAKQHALYVAGEREDPRALLHMQRSGHFEFGLDRRPINPGNDSVTAEVLNLWREGREIQGLGALLERSIWLCAPQSGGLENTA